jgi:hypothetical protein
MAYIETFERASQKGGRGKTSGRSLKKINFIDFDLSWLFGNGNDMEPVCVCVWLAAIRWM